MEGAMRHVIIENTPGYMPEDTDPPEFRTYHEAMRYLIDYNRRLAEDMEIYYVGAIENGWFTYNVTESPHDLGRSVSIERIEEDG